ncbi:MAG: hypothetical protein WKF83_08500 [Nocardioidaceae bacterium]
MQERAAHGRCTPSASWRRWVGLEERVHHGAHRHGFEPDLSGAHQRPGEPPALPERPTVVHAAQLYAGNHRSHRASSHSRARSTSACAATNTSSMTSMLVTGSASTHWS